MFLRSISDKDIADQLANLLNRHNQLGSQKSPNILLSSQSKYVVETHGKILIGACALERQSYNFTEIKHLVVDPQWRGKGVGKFLVKRCLQLVDTPMVYATVRETNEVSISLFESLGFTRSIKYGTNQRGVVLMLKANPKWKRTCQLSPSFDPRITLPFPLSGMSIASSSIPEDAT